MYQTWAIMKKENLSQIKFDNKAIDKIKVEDLDFSYINKAGENKFRRKIYIFSLRIL